MATVNAAREEFEAAKVAALRAAGKVPKEAVIRIFVILLDILIVVLLEKTTHEPELRSAAVTDGQERAGSNGPKPNRQMGDNLRKTIVEEAVDACDACGADGVDPVDRERRTTSCSRSSSAAPRSRNARSAKPGAGSPTTSRAVRHRHPGPRHQPAGRPDAVPAPCRRARAGDLRHQALRGLGYAFTMRSRRRPPWRTSCNARCLRFRINSKWLHVVGTLTCKFPHRKRGREARDHPMLQARPGPRTWASVATSCAAATCCAN